MNPAAESGNPSSTPSRTVPWDGTTELEPGFTTLVALDDGGEPFVGNSVPSGSSSSTQCQARANVFAAGADGGTTDNPPLRILVLEGILAQTPLCESTRDPRPPYFPAIVVYGTSLFVADDFNDAIAAYPAGGRGNVKATLRIAGSSTGLNEPIALVVSSVSGRAKARPGSSPESTRSLH